MKLEINTSQAAKEAPRGKAMNGSQSFLQIIREKFQGPGLSPITQRSTITQKLTRLASPIIADA